MFFKAPPNVTVIISEQPSKALAPILVTEPGMDMPVNPAQP